MFRRSRRVLGAIVASALAATLLGVFTSKPAQAATERNGVCESGEFCFYYNSNLGGSLSDHSHSLADYGASQPTCYEFKGSGSGKGQCIKNNAASVWNRRSTTARVYYNSNYGSSIWYQDFPPGAKWNLSTNLKNNNASHKILSTTKVTYKAKNDYPYPTKSWCCADPWRFFYRECTSFAAWVVTSRLRVDNFGNYYKGVHWGNAHNWDNAARSAGIPVYSTPKAGDIAVRNSGTYGHLGFVTKVNSDGTFEVDEYNKGGAHNYSHRTASVGTSSSQFDKFIRFR